MVYWSSLELLLNTNIGEFITRTVEL